MVTKKIRAIWQLIRANQLFLFTQRKTGDDVLALGMGVGDLQDMMLIAIEIKKSYNSMVNMIEQAAVEGGELHLLNELKKTIQEIEKDARND